MDEEIKKRVQYLSDNFDKFECRKELYEIIHKYLKKGKEINYDRKDNN